MATSNEWTHWHLTPRGWERGSTRLDHEGIKTRPDPEGSVLMHIYSEEIASHFTQAIKKELSGPHRIGDPDAISTLLAEFGPCPNGL